jgi:hypothetical protein
MFTQSPLGRKRKYIKKRRKVFLTPRHHLLRGFLSHVGGMLAPHGDLLYQPSSGAILQTPAHLQSLLNPRAAGPSNPVPGLHPSFLMNATQLLKDFLSLQQVPLAFVFTHTTLLEDLCFLIL